MADGTRTHLEAWNLRLAEFEESSRVGPVRAAFERMRRNKLLLLGSALGILVLFAGVLGPVVSGADPNFQSFSTTLLPPGGEGSFLKDLLPGEGSLTDRLAVFWKDLLAGEADLTDRLAKMWDRAVKIIKLDWGTDHLGRDMAARVFIGIRVSLMVAAGVTLLSLILGLVLGMIGGYLGGWRDRTIRGVVDFVWGFPLILVAVLFAGGLGQGLFPVILAVGLVNTAAIARVVRGEVLSLSEREFVEAARAGGLSTARIMWRHLFPNILAPALVLASYYVAVAIIAEAALSFIGLGAQPPTPSLGGMVSDGRNYLQQNHWGATIPGITIVLLVLAVSLIGDGLRDVFDPRLRHEAKGVDEG